MGPYLINDPKLLESLPGSAGVVPPSDKKYGVQCVGLIKYYSNAGAAFLWNAGDKVISSKLLAKGTAIATFDKKDGKYKSHQHGNHACFFISFSTEGILVLEQHVPPEPNKIQTRIIKARGSAAIGVSPSDNADAYSVIL